MGFTDFLRRLFPDRGCPARMAIDDWERSKARVGFHPPSVEQVMLVYRAIADGRLGREGVDMLVAWHSAGYLCCIWASTVTAKLVTDKHWVEWSRLHIESLDCPDAARDFLSLCDAHPELVKLPAFKRAIATYVHFS